MRGAFFIIFGLFLLALIPKAFADSIVIDDTRYDGVYIGSGASMYYVQNPADGSMLSVPKSTVRSADVKLTKNRIERQKLYNAWKKKHSARGDAMPLTVTYDEWRDRLKETLPAPETKQASVDIKTEAPKDVIQPAKNKRISKAHIQMANRAKKNAQRLSGRKTFLDENGVKLATNRPERYRGKDGYVEVTLHYEPIEVPKRFKADSADTANRTSLDDIVSFYAKKYRLDENLIFALIRTESNGNPFAVSAAGARGLMQLMPGTAKDMGVNDIFDPAENVAGGTQYLSKLLKLFKNNQSMALAAYNAGPGNVKKYGGIPPFEETQRFVTKVQQQHRQYIRHGKPTFEVAGWEPVEKDFLPTESKRGYQILLDNGLTVPADEVVLEGSRWLYKFKGRTGHFNESQVLAVYEPS